MAFISLVLAWTGSKFFSGIRLLRYNLTLRGDLHGLPSLSQSLFAGLVSITGSPDCLALALHDSHLCLVTDFGMIWADKVLLIL